MKIIINNSSMQPLYEQIVGAIKASIISDELKVHDSLPSVRKLAKDLKISALTVKKAYDLLEEEGFIITVHGKGSFVANTHHELLLEEQRKSVENDLEAAIHKARQYGMTDEEILEMFHLILEE